ncbi:hypothetical protein MRX96_016114 [Rhipicephalus microplus]
MGSTVAAAPMEVTANVTSSLDGERDLDSPLASLPGRFPIEATESPKGGDRRTKHEISYTTRWLPEYHHIGLCKRKETAAAKPVLAAETAAAQAHSFLSFSASQQHCLGGHQETKPIKRANVLNRPGGSGQKKRRDWVTATEGKQTSLSENGRGTVRLWPKPLRTELTERRKWKAYRRASIQFLNKLWLRTPGHSLTHGSRNNKKSGIERVLGRTKTVLQLC